MRRSNGSSAPRHGPARVAAANVKAHRKRMGNLRRRHSRAEVLVHRWLLSYSLALEGEGLDGVKAS
jgi:hypothetical protein